MLHFATPPPQTPALRENESMAANSGDVTSRVSTDTRTGLSRQDTTPQIRSNDDRFGFKTVFQKPQPLNLTRSWRSSTHFRVSKSRVRYDSHCKHRRRNDRVS